MRSGALAVLAALVACDRSLPPAPEVVLYVDTDAIVATTKPDPLALGTQVDRVRFDLTVDGVAVPNGTSVFSVDDAMFRDGKVSFGIVTSGARTPAVRVRLYRADRLIDTDDIPTGVAIDATVGLPQPGAEILAVHAFLSAESFGVPGPVMAEPGPPATSKVGTWHGGRRVGCAAAPGAGEACVAGGAYFFGDPALRGRSLTDVFAERLVWVSPFYLDAHEVTVADFRAAGLAGVEEPTPRAEAASPSELPYCTWSTAKDARETLPLTCVTWATARAYCQKQGKDLPSEAQYELVASGSGDERAYPWGNDDIDCSGAVWGRGGDGPYAQGSAICRIGVASEPAAPGSGTRDIVDPSVRGGAGAPIVDLGGNVSEWMLDDGSAPDGFWGPVARMLDPVQTGGPPDGQKALRGGSFPRTLLELRGGLRLLRPGTQIAATGGFRCARHAEPAVLP